MAQAKWGMQQAATEYITRACHRERSYPSFIIFINDLLDEFSGGGGGGGGGRPWSSAFADDPGEDGQDGSLE